MAAPITSVEIQILEDVLSAFGLAVGGALTYLTTKVVPKYIHSQTAQSAIDGLASIAESVVAQFNQTIVADAKANGVWNAALATKVKQDAVNAVLSQGANLVKLAEKVVGDVPELVSTLIEQAVAKSKVK
ncbi:hypothetical protein [Alicyclobacillus vulcanalis]|uniref:Holin n=1 Tax=Alicyclobacillus vulcanalis TaxID=252246 RepID=A0A1N7MPY3_9BACL|nr:hypothetical protein [Alicyclobacillus vulcanalis]SIS87991.1 hypothetical protein SAMN05421799_1069 [Alicyclobacillus vulcanalis]